MERCWKYVPCFGSVAKDSKSDVIWNLDSLQWSSDNTDMLSISPKGREAFLDFKSEGTAVVTVRSETNIVFILRVRGSTQENKEPGSSRQKWVADFWRQNASGKWIDIYGEAH